MYDIIQEGVGRVPEKLILADRREVELNKVSQADPTGNKYMDDRDAHKTYIQEHKKCPEIQESRASHSYLYV